ncbi:MAG: GntR family transcriptional regulator, partial [Betaproteobacteria bacterium]|nr:GntR family transcriptional regulator [Betaproteobacteria bacterium]
MPLPKYHQVYLVLREQLHEGKFAQGLPGELALMSQFGVARVTVRRALEQLAQEGLISREPGRGTRPVATRTSHPAQHSGAAQQQQQAQLSGLLENLVTMGLRTTVKVLSVDKIAASQEVASALQLQDGAWVQKAQRVR